MINATKEFDIPIRKKTGQISGFVKSRTWIWMKRIGDKFFRCLFWPIKVTQG